MLTAPRRWACFQLESEGMKPRLPPSSNRRGSRISSHWWRSIDRADGVDPAVHRGQARPFETDLRAPETGSDPRRYAGIAMYQESIMQIVRDCAGLAARQADETAKGGRRSRREIPVYKEQFIAGVRTTASESDVAEQIFAFIEPFAATFQQGGTRRRTVDRLPDRVSQGETIRCSIFRADVVGGATRPTKLVDTSTRRRRWHSVLPPTSTRPLFEFCGRRRSDPIRIAAIKGSARAPCAASLRRGPRAARSALFDLVDRVDVKA